MENVNITHHGFKRGKQRAGLDARAMKNTAEKAWENGVRPSETTGRLKRYLDAQAINHKCIPRIYGNQIYCFGKEAVVITVLHLPQEYRGAAASALKKRGK